MQTQEPLLARIVLASTEFAQIRRFGVMSRIVYVFLSVVVMWNLAALSASPNNTSSSRIVGYYASWSAHSGYFAAEIRGDLLTHINYAFANISDDGMAILGDPCLDIGRCAQGETALTSGGNFAQLLRLKERHPHLRILVAIGGWNWSGNFSDAALTPTSRRRLVTSALELFLDRWPGLFDGFDLDWEYPVAGGRPENHYRPQDWENYSLLIAEFRRELDKRGAAASRRYLLTVAAPAVAAGGIGNIGWARIGDNVDWINLMTYDYHTGGNIAHFNAPLFAAPDDPTPNLNVQATVQRYLAAGVPRDKITVGLPFFGYGYGGVGTVRDGLFQTAEQDSLKTKAKSASQDWGIGAVSFRELRGAHERKFKRFWHPEAQVPWLFNAESRVWISYDDSQSLGLKSDYVRNQNLGGVMIWELGGDDGTLLEGINRRLNSRKKEKMSPH